MDQEQSTHQNLPLLTEAEKLAIVAQARDYIEKLANALADSGKDPSKAGYRLYTGSKIGAPSLRALLGYKGEDKENGGAHLPDEYFRQVQEYIAGHPVRVRPLIKPDAEIAQKITGMLHRLDELSEPFQRVHQLGWIGLHSALSDLGYNVSPANIKRFQEYIDETRGYLEANELLPRASEQERQEVKQFINSDPLQELANTLNKLVTDREAPGEKRAGSSQSAVKRYLVSASAPQAETRWSRGS